MAVSDAVASGKMYRSDLSIVETGDAFTGLGYFTVWERALYSKRRWLLQTAAETILQNQDKSLVFTTPSALTKAITRLRVATTGSVTVRVLEAPTVDTAGATAQTFRNKDMSNTDACPITDQVLVGNGKVTTDNITIRVTSNRLVGGYKDVTVPVNYLDSANDVAAKARVALAADATIAANFTVSGSNANIALTTITREADDATMATTLQDAHGSGVTLGASGNTTPGAAGTKQQETIQFTAGASANGKLTITITAAGMTGGTQAVECAVASGDNAAQVCTKVAAALNLNAILAAFFTITPSTDTLTLEKKTAAANDATLAIALTSDGATGCTVGASANTRAGVAGTLQQETLPVTAGATVSGNIEITVTAAGMGNSPKAVSLAVAAADDASAVAGKIRTALGLDADVAAFFTISGAGANVILTAKTKAANDGTMAMALTSDGATGVTVGASANTRAGTLGTKQIETGTVTNGAGADGVIVVRVTSALWGAPIDVGVAVANGDDASAVGGKIRTEIGLDAGITADFVVSGATTDTILTAKVEAANDTSLAFSITNADGTGVTMSSANTTPGVAPTTQIETIEFTAGAGKTSTLTVRVTAAGMAGSPIDVLVPVVAGDNAAAVAGKARTAVGADAGVTAFFTVGGTGAFLELTAKVAAANDGTMAIALQGAGATGVAVDASADTTGGVAPVAQQETITVTGGATYSGTLVFRVTAAGMAGSPVDTEVAVVAGDNAATVAGKIRTAIGLVAAITAFFTVGGTGADILLTAKAAAADDGTMAMALQSAGTTSVTVGASTDAVAGVLGTQQVETVAVATGATAAPTGMEFPIEMFYSTVDGQQDIILKPATLYAVQVIENDAGAATAQWFVDMAMYPAATI